MFPNVPDRIGISVGGVGFKESTRKKKKKLSGQGREVTTNKYSLTHVSLVIVALFCQVNILQNIL